MIAKVLTIAGFDSSGGAGIQADLKTFSAWGCYGMSVLTALPIQNTCGVKNCYDIPLPAIEEQLEVIFDDIVPDAIKIGMLFTREIICLVANFLKTYALTIPIVLDPVMVAKSGDRLLLPCAVEVLKKELLPLVTILTPNLLEAEELTGKKIVDEEEMPLMATLLLAQGPQAVLVKGGHLTSEKSTDFYLEKKGQTKWLMKERIVTPNTHGTGCTLSAAIASALALGYSPLVACQMAKDYLHQALQAGKYYSLGQGHGPVHHFYHLWPTIDKLKGTHNETLSDPMVAN